MYEYTVSLESETRVPHKILRSQTQIGRLNFYHI